ncbi:MAG: hypothetical protein JNM41_11195 [Flavipsychrobacter sp.]|nr:hypothetical protein [Flavipsychrobacter sp.]
MITYDNTIKETKVTVFHAADHEATMQGLITALRLAIAHPDKRTGDEEALQVVCDLLAAIIPNEGQLENGVKYDKPARIGKAA